MTSIQSLTNSTGDGGHADDATLTRFIDGEFAPEEQSALAHAAGCPECQARVDAIRQRLARLRELLASTDAAPAAAPNVDNVLAEAHRRRMSRPAGSSPADVRRRRPGRRTVLAAALVMSGAALAAQPLSQWVMSRWQRSDARPPAAPPVVAVEHSTASPAAIAFIPEPGTFTVRFDAVPALGTVALVADTGIKVVADITSGAADEGLFVLPDGLRIRNSGRSAATYRVVLPPAVTRVRLEIGRGAGSRSVIIPLEPGRTRVIPLRE